MRFGRVQSFRVRTDPVGLLCTLSTRNPLVKMSISHSSFHGSRWKHPGSRIDFTLPRKGWRDLSLGVAIPSSWIGHVEFVRVHNTVFCRRIREGSILAKTGNHCNFLDTPGKVCILNTHLKKIWKNVNFSRSL